MTVRPRSSRVSPRLARELGLVQEGPLPSRDRIRLTFHAVQRFRQRCAPELSIDDARRSLAGLVARSSIARTRPKWLGRESVEERAFTTVGYAVVAEGVAVPFALPLVGGADGVRAPTCLVKGGPR